MMKFLFNIILRQIHFLLCLISQLVTSPPPHFYRQARNPRFSFLSIIPDIFFFYFRLHIQYCFEPRHFFPSHIIPNIAYLSTQLFNHSRFSFLAHLACQALYIVKYNIPTEKYIAITNTCTYNVCPSHDQ